MQYSKGLFSSALGRTVFLPKCTFTISSGEGDVGTSPELALGTEKYFEALK